MANSDPISKWRQSSNAWITLQGETGDFARSQVLDPALANILPTLKEKTVLDVGCGEGRLCRQLSEQGAITTGIDPAPEFIAHAQSKHPSGTYLEAVAESLPFPDNSFDLVISYLTLIDIPDDRAAANEMVRVLKPGGQIFIVTISNMGSCTPGWVKDENGKHLYRTIDRYMEHFSMELAWGGLEIINYHRPLSHTLNLFLSQGMVLTHFLEPLPPESSEHFEQEFRCPTFQILAFKSPDN